MLLFSGQGLQLQMEVEIQISQLGTRTQRLIGGVCRISYTNSATVQRICSRLGTSLQGASISLQDRTGGDFTLYDFFDNIFSFSESPT